MTVKPTVSPIWASDGAALIATPLPAKIETGWVVEKPPVEYMNWLQNQFSKFINHVNEYGVPVHDTATTYPLGALVSGSNGKIYQSKQAANTNNEPTTDDGTWWRKFGGGPLIEPPKYSTAFNYSADNYWWGDWAGNIVERPYLSSTSVPVSDVDQVGMRLQDLAMARVRKSDHLVIWNHNYSAMSVNGEAVRRIMAYYYDTVDSLIYAVVETATTHDAWLISINPTTGAYTVHIQVVAVDVATHNSFYCFLDRVGGAEGTGNFLLTYKLNGQDDITKYVTFTTSATVSSGNIETENSYQTPTISYFSADTKVTLSHVVVDESAPGHNSLILYIRRGGTDRAIRVPIEHSPLGAVLDMSIVEPTTISIDLWAGDVLMTSARVHTTPVANRSDYSTSVNYLDRVDFDRWLNDWCTHEKMNPGTAFTLA